MTMPLGNPFTLGATGVTTSARFDRTALGAHFRPNTAAVSAVSGFLAGPTNTQGELSLVSDTLLRVQPFTAVVQGTNNSQQGQYVVPNGTQRDLAVVAKDASLFRRALIVVRVADSLEAGVASSATTDGAWLEIVPGTLAASNPVLPATPANALAAGELSIPSVASGQPVTLTPYNPRTTGRGGILPVFADTSTVPGHGNAPGLHLGEYRDHPARGLERWNGAGWGLPTVRPLFQGYAAAAVTGIPAGWVDLAFATENWDSHNGHGADPFAYVIPESGPYALEGLVVFAANAGNPVRDARVTINGVVYPNGGNGGGQFGTAQTGVPTGRKVYYLDAGAVVRLQGYSSVVWATVSGGGVASTLTVERLIG